MLTRASSFLHDWRGGRYNTLWAVAPPRCADSPLLDALRARHRARLAPSAPFTRCDAAAATTSAAAESNGGSGGSGAARIAEAECVLALPL